MTSDAPGPGQEIAVQIINLAQKIIDQNTITIRWTPAHRGVEGPARERRRQRPSLFQEPRLDITALPSSDEGQRSGPPPGSERI